MFVGSGALASPHRALHLIMPSTNHHICVVLALVVVGCGSSPRLDGGGNNTDASVDATTDAPDQPDADPAVPDADPPDASPPDADPPDATPPDAAEPVDLVALCGAEPVTFDDWERCYQKRLCEWYVQCPTNSYRDVEECIAEYDAVSGGRIGWRVRERRRAVEEGLATLDVEHFTRCLAETDPGRCTTAATHVSCALRYRGAVEDGNACHADVECASPAARCEKDCAEACCEGTCRRRARIGEECRTYDACEPGLRCGIITDQDWRCVSGDVGSRCTNLTQCDANAWCDEQAGICKADLPAGAQCGDILQCGGDTTCVGYLIHPPFGKCLRVTEPGDPCDDFCRGSLRCVSNGAGQLGRCEPPPGPGESCSLSCSGVTNECRSGRCVPRVDVGVECGNATCLPGLFCAPRRDGQRAVCEAPRPAGEPCTGSAQCESYLCSGSAGTPGVCLPWSDRCTTPTFD